MFEEKLACPFCKSEDIEEDAGFDISIEGEERQHLCRNCGKTLSEIITFEGEVIKTENASLRVAKFRR